MKEIYLPCGRVTIVSDVDYDRVRQYKWRTHEANGSGKPYVITSIRKLCGKRTTLYLHRFITECPLVYKVDHIDRDTLHNWRTNLRITNFGQNNANRMGFGEVPFKGVTRDGRRYRARITKEGMPQNLGQFDRPEDAARAYDKIAHELFGEFAYLNFPDEYPRPQSEFEEIEIPF